MVVVRESGPQKPYTLWTQDKMDGVGSAQDGARMPGPDSGM